MSVLSGGLLGSLTARTRRVLLVLTALVLVLAVVIVAAVGTLHLIGAKGAAPEHTGKHIDVAHIPDGFWLATDSTGMPHIQADNLQAGGAGLCYVMGRDRTFQLDELRRFGDGTAAAILGPALVAQDKVFRALDLDALAQAHFRAAPPAAQAVLSACADGINAAFAQFGPSTPEFSLLHYSPASWQGWDSLTVIEFAAASLDLSAAYTKLTRAAAIALGGPAGAQLSAALIPNPPTSPSMFNAQGQLNPLADFLGASASSAGSGSASLSPPASASAASGALPALGTLASLAQLPTGLGFGPATESNNFVVAGTHTSTGMPLLANDPHLALMTPSLFYAAQLTVTGGENAEGFLLPGVPAFIIGHTQHVAWGVTFAMLNDVDLYVEQLQPVTAAAAQQLHVAHPTVAPALAAPCGTPTIAEEVQFDGQEAPVSTCAYTLQVAGASPQSFSVRYTPHGPILNDATTGLDSFGTLSLDFTAEASAWTISGMLALPSDLAGASSFASSWHVFQSDLSHESIGLNFVYADNFGKHGDIGYQETGLAPQRDPTNLLLPVPGGDGQHEWTGFATPAELASVTNPPDGLLATANNRIHPDDAPVETGNGVYDLPWRVETIYRALYALTSHGGMVSPTDAERIQLSTQSVPAPALSHTIQAALGRVGLPNGDVHAAASLAALSSWNGDVAADSKGAAIYETTLAYLMLDLAAPLMGPAYGLYTQGVFIASQIAAVQQALASPTPPLFGATSASDAQHAADLAVQHALAQADAALTTVEGASDASWSWGGIHTLTYNAPAAALDPHFAIGTFPTAGDGTSVATGGWFQSIAALAAPSTPGAATNKTDLLTAFAQDAVPCIRVVWDLSNWSASPGVNSTGQSGNPTSSHYADDAALWRAGQYHAMSYLPTTS